MKSCLNSMSCVNRYPDYPIDQHFGRPVSTSQMNRALIFDYIQGRAEKSNLRALILFDRELKSVSWSAETQEFELVLSKDLCSSKGLSQNFRCTDLIVANGNNISLIFRHSDMMIFAKGASPRQRSRKFQASKNFQE